MVGSITWLITTLFDVFSLGLFIYANIYNMVYIVNIYELISEICIKSVSSIFIYSVVMLLYYIVFVNSNYIKLSYSSVTYVNITMLISVMLSIIQS